MNLWLLEHHRTCTQMRIILCVRFDLESGKENEPYFIVNSLYFYSFFSTGRYIKMFVNYINSMPKTASELTKVWWNYGKIHNMYSQAEVKIQAQNICNLQNYL